MSKIVKTAPATKPAAQTTDTGRVKVGGGLLRFSVKTDKSTHDAGRVVVGGGLKRF